MEVKVRAEAEVDIRCLQENRPFGAKREVFSLDTDPSIGC
jgi:hypothetical protein